MIQLTKSFIMDVMLKSSSNWLLVAYENEKELNQALARSERLGQSILKRAFEGRLVGREEIAS